MTKSKKTESLQSKASGNTQVGAKGMFMEVMNEQFASTTLTVIVNGGIPPLSIQVIFYEDRIEKLHFSASSSFTHVFDSLKTGSNYDIIIGGFNPAGGNTVCSITTDEITLTSISDPNPSQVTGVSYRVDFNFNV